MTWLTMVVAILGFVALALLTGGDSDALPSDARRRMHDRLAKGGFPLESWEIY